MRQSKVKKIRQYVRKTDVPKETRYLEVRTSHTSPNKTVIMDDCQRKLVKHLKKVS